MRANFPGYIDFSLQNICLSSEELRHLLLQPRPTAGYILYLFRDAMIIIQERGGGDNRNDK